MSPPRALPPKDVALGVVVNDQARDLFSTLPIEARQQIAALLDSDISLCAFRATCRSVHNAIDQDNFSFWRRRFIAQFEPTGWSSEQNVKYKEAYHHRRRVLKNGATFKGGKTKEERECLDLVRDLIVGAFGPGNKPVTAHTLPDSRPESNNLTRLLSFLHSTNLLTTIFKPIPTQNRYGLPIAQTRPDPLLTTIRVICAPLLLSLDPHLIHEHYGFPDSQFAVYAPAIHQSFFGGRTGLDVNMEFVLHHINFWRYHMVRPVEQTLFTAFAELDADARPQWWNSQLTQGSKTLGKYWKGSYAYLDHAELEDLRAAGDDRDDVSVQFQDIFAGEDAAFSFQDMELHVVEDRKMRWPEIFERHLRSLTPPSPPRKPTGVRTRAQKRSEFTCSSEVEEVANFKPLSFRFNGSGEDSTESFLASGWLNPLPPQQGIPGWQRLTMMKYFEHEDIEVGAGVYGSNVDWSALWAYEGVVLPGGKIVVGRWWSPDSVGDGDVGENQYSGPFILWCVDGAEGYRVFDEEDEMEYERSE